MSKQIEQAIVRIQDSDGNIFGSGFLVCCNQVLTCAHVVADSLRVSRESQETPELTVFMDFPLLEKKSISLPSVIKYWDSKLDIALMEILADVPEGAIPIELEEVEDYSYCDFGVCGFPKDIGDWTYGKMLGKLENGYIQVESETAHRIQGGYSGGAVWHRTEERLAGMVVACDEDKPEDKVAYIIPASFLLNTFPHLRKPAQISSQLKHVCFLSFPIDSNSRLIEKAVEEIKTDLEEELKAQLTKANLDNERHIVLAASTRTAKDLCESACMVMIYTLRYFDQDDPLCAQEYQAMLLLEQTRLKELNIVQTKTTSFIIPIVIRGMKQLPQKINSSRQVFDFSKYFTLGNKDRRMRTGYLNAIEEIANHIVSHYMILEKRLPNSCSNCGNFELPKAQEVKDILIDLAPTYSWFFGT